MNDKNYPYEMVQLRYTKRSDNGPVDTNLCTFVENWNKLYKFPKLQISSVPTLFKDFENKHGKEIETLTGEISPYWEDGAFSTAVEEANLRLLVKKTIALEKHLKSRKLYQGYTEEIYKLHRNIVMFQEHTWGSWCSISDPEIPFTTEQWEYKKAFLDSAQFYFDLLQNKSGFIYLKDKTNRKASKLIKSFQIDTITGGITMLDQNNNALITSGSGQLFEVIYSLGINPSVVSQAKFISTKSLSNNKKNQSLEVELSLPNLSSNLKVIYTLYKKESRITCRFIFDKKEEKNKESLHFAFNIASDTIFYKSGERRIALTKDQLPGSNHDFICTEDELILKTQQYQFTINSPAFNLFEIGTLVDETTINGAKIWKVAASNFNAVYLYVLNNYWHTNYKAYQGGHFDYEVAVLVEKI